MENPRQFKITIGADDLKFNHIISVDTILIFGKPIIHIVDETTHFSPAKFLNTKYATEVGNSISKL